MVLVVASARNIERGPRVVGKRFEKVEKQFRGQVAHSFTTEICVPNQPGTTREINCCLGQRLIHRQKKPVARESPLIAEGLRKSGAQSQSSVLNGMMLINVQVALYGYV